MKELELTKHQLGIIIEELNRAIAGNRNCIAREEEQWIQDIFKERADTLTELRDYIKEIQITGSFTIINKGRK